MEEQQNEKMSPKARWIIGGIVTICLAVLIVVAIQLNKKQEPEVATEATQDKKEKTADEQIGSDLEKALSELKKDKSSEDKKTDSKDKTTATKSSDPFAYLFNPSKSDDPLTFLSIDPTELPDVPEPVVSKTEDVAGVQDDKTPKGPVVTLPTDKITDLPTVPSLPTSDDPTLPSDAVDEGDGDDKVPTDVPGTVIPPSDNPNPEPDNPNPEPNNPNPEPDNPNPEPDNPNPEPNNPDPEPNNPSPDPDEQYTEVSIALPEETYDRLVYYAKQNRENDVLYYGNDTLSEETIKLMNEMLGRYQDPKNESITARQLVQALNQSQLNTEEAKLYNAQLAKLKEEIEKVTREEFVDVYVIKNADSKDQLYYAGTFSDLMDGNEQQFENAKNSVMSEADKKASEAAANLGNKLTEDDREKNKQALIDAINSYQLVANYSTEDGKEAAAKRSEALRTLSEATQVEEEQEVEYTSKPKEDDEEKIKEFFDDLMKDKKYVQTLQQASAYIEKYPDLQDIINEASEKLLDQSVEKMKSNSAYNDKYTKDHLAQSYAALTGLSTVPSEISKKAQDEFYGYRLVMQAEKLIDEDPTQAVIFAHEGYKRQETDGAKGVLQKANTALSEKAVGMDEEKAERAYEILTVTAKDVNEDIAQTAVDRKTAYGYVAAGEKQYNAGKTQEAIAYGSEANRLYPEKNLGGALVEKAANRLLEEAEQKELTAQTETYNLIVNVKGLDESIKTQAQSRKTVIDILDRVNTLEKQEQNAEENTQQGLYYLNEAVAALENTGWSDEEKAKIQQRYDAHVSSMLEQAQTWSTGSKEEIEKAATYYKAVAEIGKYAGEETRANAKTALTELGYE
ncbi:hypothetical protein [Priestia endophytica]|uniref:Uncharacterized protein n=1 Tax=Priestia endophytica TaxID=135735 RepID=A0AAX1QFX3_9BACI|nr:hypothetical protein [Priestia endophytica]RAS82157.1 hypothetical protein A3864_01215 [Priestia endophytica]